MRQPMLMASLSKCHLCRQYHYSAGKQPVNILAGEEISFRSNLSEMVAICVFLRQRSGGQSQSRTSSERVKKRGGGGEQVCRRGHERGCFH